MQNNCILVYNVKKVKINNKNVNSFFDTEYIQIYSIRYDVMNLLIINIVYAYQCSV